MFSQLRRAGRRTTYGVQKNSSASNVLDLLDDLSSGEEEKCVTLNDFVLRGMIEGQMDLMLLFQTWAFDSLLT